MVLYFFPPNLDISDSTVSVTSYVFKPSNSKICCHMKNVKNLSATAKMDVFKLCSLNSTVSKSAETVILLFIVGSVTSYVQSFIHSLIYSFTSLPREDSSLSCHVIPMNYWNLHPWIIQQQKMGEGWVCVCVGGGYHSCLTLYPLWSFMRSFYLLLHIWWPHLLDLMMETLLAIRYLISGSFESQRPDWVSTA